ncbi:Unconventional myosin-IXa [Thelohanellus kitauei]|uniref:Unconventional myosin-IXa n=1 Tax=Thelohanellus kitauei TaxID=669202 RepID=A0A0C2N075_THEKT|nr:Unconventional myosin-IXa [Thelohanellus kitauei]
MSNSPRRSFKISSGPQMGQIKINTCLLNSKDDYLNLVIWNDYRCKKIVKLLRSKFPEYFKTLTKYTLATVSKVIFAENSPNTEGWTDTLIKLSVPLKPLIAINQQVENFIFGYDAFPMIDDVILICERSKLLHSLHAGSDTMLESLPSVPEKLNDLDLHLADHLEHTRPWATVHHDDNLVDLVHLTEEYLVRKLFDRYRRGCFYSHIDNILIFINPYSLLPIYNPKFSNLYRNHEKGTLPPHVYGMVDRAYYDMLNNKISQCILVSGESGSGKTETLKHVIQHVTFLNQFGSSSGLVSAIQASTTVLEAFGNAMNIQNKNSSRFGNFTEIMFSKDGVITWYLFP